MGSMRPPAQPTRYTLVPKTQNNPAMRRYSLARLAPSPSFAVGQDRPEARERAAAPFRQA